MNVLRKENLKPIALILIVIGLYFMILNIFFIAVWAADYIDKAIGFIQGL